MCSYNPHMNTTQDHINAISRQCDYLNEKYEYSFLLGDLNSEVHRVFCKNTVYKNIQAQNS